MSDTESCPNIPRCELFPRLSTGGALGYCLDAYCYSEFTRCARYRFVQEQGRRPPSTLLPNGGELRETKGP